MIKKSIMIFIYSARYSCQTLMKLKFFQQIFEKYSNISFMKIRPVGAELFLADTRGEANSHFSQFFERT